MPRLQILHHKSYHPYNEKNKARVREDEARARQELEEQEQEAIDSESRRRLNELRRRAGSPSAEAGPSEDKQLEKLKREKERRRKDEKRERKLKERLEYDWPSKTKEKEERRERRRRERGEEADGEAEGDAFADKFQSGGHLNLWADMESERPPQPAADPARRRAAQEADKLTMYLERPERETRPWYADRNLKGVEEVGEEAERRRARDQRADLRAKNLNDPLLAIQAKLAAKKRAAQPARPTWSEKFEREKDLAGNRFASGAEWERHGRGRR